MQQYFNNVVPALRNNSTDRVYLQVLFLNHGYNANKSDILLTVCLQPVNEGQSIFSTLNL